MFDTLSDRLGSVFDRLRGRGALSEAAGATELCRVRCIDEDPFAARRAPAARFCERGVTVLLVEQRAQRTVAFADRTYVLSNGELSTTLGPGDAGDTDRLIAAYFGR